MSDGTLRLRVAWGIACALWSATFLFIRIGLADIGPFTFAAARLALALTVIVPLFLWTREARTLSRGDVKHIAAAGALLLGVNYALVYWGAQHVPSALVAILLAATPIFALALGAALHTETVTARKVAAVLIGFTGVVVIFGVEAAAAGRQAVTGIAALLASAGCVAGAYVWMKRRASRVPPLSMAAIQNAAGLVPLLVLAVALEGSPLEARWTPRAFGALLYLAYGASVLAFWLNYWLLARMDPSAMLMMGVAEVPLAIGLGALVLGERLPAGTLIGAACIAVSVLIGPMRRAQPSAAATTRSTAQ
jgi:drug/metabolite transporter (DMT)-like permease